MKNDSLSRIRMLTGSSTMAMLQQTSVILFGVGGVGSWCAEALVRSGIGRLTLVDYDLICRSNINRQVQATAATVGCVKVDVLARRLREINPSAAIVARQEIYRHGLAPHFNLGAYHYVIDAIDSLSAKVDLIMSATHAGATVFTSLGASCRIDPTNIKISSLWDSQACRLGRLVRKRLRRRNFTGNPLCVYSEELVIRRKENEATHHSTSNCVANPSEDQMVSDGHHGKERQINGSAVHITGTFGFFLAGMVINDVMCKASETLVL